MTPDKNTGETERFLITEYNFYSWFGNIKSCHNTFIALTCVYHEEHYVNVFLLFCALRESGSPYACFCQCFLIRSVVGHCLVFSFTRRPITLAGKGVDYLMFFLVTVKNVSLNRRVDYD